MVELLEEQFVFFFQVLASFVRLAFDLIEFCLQISELFAGLSGSTVVFLERIEFAAQVAILLESGLQLFLHLMQLLQQQFVFFFQFLSARPRVLDQGIEFAVDLFHGRQ